MRILLTSNTSWYLYNFRFNFIEKLIDLGYEVHIISPFDIYVNKLLKLGIKHHDIKLTRFKKNIFKDLFFIFKLYSLYKKIKPNIIHNFTIKPVIYGSIAAWFFPYIKVINSIPGLGILFLNKNKFSFSNFFIKKLYKFSILNKYKAIFQNPDDMNFFINNNILNKEQCFLIKGSGVDLIRFTKINRKKDEQFINFGLMGRMLWSKGVKEFIDSSRIVFNKNNNTRFFILGSPDKNNPNAIPIDWLEKENNKKYIFWEPHKDNVVDFLNKIDVFVLPTYYPEGLPKSLLEAAAMKLPLIATNTPGCNKIIKDGTNGFLIDIKDSYQLADKMYNLSIDNSLRYSMGLESRKIVEKEYDVNIINKKTIEIYNK